MIALLLTLILVWDAVARTIANRIMGWDKRPDYFTVAKQRRYDANHLYYEKARQTAAEYPWLIDHYNKLEKGNFDE